MRWGALVLIGVIAVAAGAARGSDHPANVHWERFLPALPSPSEIQPHGVPHCRRATIRCIDVEIRRLRRLRDELGCDHRAVFATTYLELTKTLREVLEEEPEFLRYPRYLYVEDALFANVYFRSVRRDARGKPVPPAWRIAFDAARTKELNGAQDMLLGINAHVQNDMPFVLAALGLRARSGESRKVDHDAINDVLDRSYKGVVAAVRDRYDAQVGTTNSELLPADDVLGLEMVKGWRELVWRNAERLVNAEDAAERRRVADQIKANAAAWARGFAAVEQPGHRDRRAAHCRDRLGSGPGSG
ncbi:MAG TPA: DUF5995 family protein [Thermoleophilaceae bacterium]|nr:DUF5995 family protein [Thermoleophilaceae bacterium]